MDAARSERRGEDGEDKERLGFSGGELVTQGETGDEGDSDPEIRRLQVMSLVGLVRALDLSSG